MAFQYSGLSESEISAIERLVDDIVEIIPSSSDPVEERRAKNDIVRQKMPQLNNYSLATLCYCYSHQLSFEELRRRFENKSLTFREICLILECHWERYHSPFRKLLYQMIQYLPEIIQQVDPSEITEMAKLHVIKETGEDCGVPLKAAMLREDAKTIIESLIASDPKHEGLYSYWLQQVAKNPT